MIVGGRYSSNNAGDFEVLDIFGRQCKIRFIDTGYETIKAYWDVKRGEVEDKLLKRVYGVGYVGGDIYLPSDNRKHNKEYSAWRDMLRRCYTEHGGNRTLSYSNVDCIEDWHNFQIFAEWYITQPNYGKADFELDKDLTLFGNKQYSPEVCELIPKELNSLFIGVFDNKSRPLPKGVSRSKRDGYYRVRLNNFISGKTINKYGKDPIVLGKIYAKLKQELTCEVVDIYFEYLSDRLKYNLINNTEKYLLKQLEIYR